MHKVIQKNSVSIIKKHFVLAETVKRLRKQYAPQKSVKDIQEIKMEHARKQRVPKETITSSDTTALAEFDQITTLFETVTKSKSFNKSLKQRALYQALVELILKDGDVMNEGLADKLKKMKPNDDVKELKDVDNFTKVISRIQSEVLKGVKEYLRSSLDDAMHKVIQKNSVSIIKKHFVLAETVKRLKKQYAPQKSVKDIQEIKMEHARKQRVPKETITSSDTTALAEFDQITTLFETKMKPNDVNKNEGPSAGSNRGLKRRKTSKDTKPSKKAKSTEISKGTSKSQPKSTGKYAQVEEIVFYARDTQWPHNLRKDTGNTDEPPIVNVDLKEWFKKLES
nr:hypothetical protein [Tanacetum cinerariifolium]